MKLNSTKFYSKNKVPATASSISKDVLAMMRVLICGRHIDLGRPLTATTVCMSYSLTSSLIQNKPIRCIISSMASSTS